MRYTRIDIEGLAGRYAIAARKADAEVIDVEMLLPDLRRMHHVQADSAEDIFSMAQCLQHQLDGYDGSNSEVQEYHLELLRLTSLAPDIIEAILRGDEPDGLSLEKLRKNLPVRWDELRRSYG
jgi:hypothetical protein